MLVEILCGPIGAQATLDEIPFVCSLFACPNVTVMYGVGCKADIDELWRESEIPTSALPEWIERSIRDGIYHPGAAGLFISSRDELTVELCHEGDIHVQTHSAAIVETCMRRWLERGYRVLKSDLVPASPGTWREIRSVREG
ncbi:MAG: hypothetical protein ABSH50_03615 [Bryobacteraceae bacterium]|jgi:hypothetical protein